MKKIFIDAGHNPTGYWNAGAVGNEMFEQDITYEVSILLADMLKKDFEIKLSRPTKDTVLGINNASAINARWQLSNSWGADYFISIHANAGGGTGAETFYFRDDALNFARTIQDTYASEMDLRNRRTERRDNLAVIRHTNHPSILLELGFIDHKGDAYMLRVKRLEMAKAIARGIYKFLGVAHSENSIETENSIQNENNKEDEEMRFNTLADIPDWARPTIEKLISLEMLNGNGESLNLSEDMLRILVINDRAGIYGDTIESLSCVPAPIKYTEKEVDMIQRIVHAEARGEDEKGQVLVANVILNRLEDPRYPDTVEEVIFQPKQFEPTRNGTFESATPQEITIQAVNKALNGEDYSQRALFFRSTNGLEGSWHQERLTHLFTHGGHAFFK